MIIIVAHVGAVKIHAVAVEAFKKKERGGQNKMKLSLSKKKDAFLSSISC